MGEHRPSRLGQPVEGEREAPRRSSRYGSRGQIDDPGEPGRERVSSPSFRQQIWISSHPAVRCRDRFCSCRRENCGAVDREGEDSVVVAQDAGLAVPRNRRSARGAPHGAGGTAASLKTQKSRSWGVPCAHHWEAASRRRGWRRPNGVGNATMLGFLSMHFLRLFPAAGR